MTDISGGHLVARVLKAEGVEAIFTLCDGHIIDIYDGCLSVQTTARSGRSSIICT